MSVLIETKKWFIKARKDLRSAFSLRKEHDWDNVCFLSQQCIEKALKGFLIQQKIVPPKIHRLERLCKMCSQFDTDFMTLIDICAKMTPYAVETRYPDLMFGIKKNEAKEAYRNAQTIYRFCKSKIKEVNSAGN